MSPVHSPTPAAGVLHEETSAPLHTSSAQPLPLPSDQFTRADLEFCVSVAQGFTRKGHEASARSWTALAVKVATVLRGEYAPFTELERDLIVSLHLNALKHLGTPGARETRRGCSRLEVLVEWAVRGNLEHLRAGGAQR